MKFIKLLVFLPVLLFSFEVEFSKNFSKNLQHDILTTHVTVMLEDDSENKVSKRLEVFDKSIKSYDKVEKQLGTYNIRPKYKYSKNTPVIIGYVGELRYKIVATKASFMDEFISNITELKENRDTSVIINDLSWTVKSSTLSVALDLLRLEAINWGMNYAKNLASDINKSCIIKKIQIDEVIQSLQKSDVMYAAKAFGSKSMPIPEVDQEKIQINPRYILECK